MEQLRLIEQDWDYLIILDACRYDYFEKIYDAFLQGSLEKRKSLGSSTPQWRDENFPDFYDDIVYISANPMICSDKEIYGFNAGKHFHKVYDIWKYSWNSKYGTVLPTNLTDQAINIIPNHKGKRFIIHYLQPHAPYICSDIEGCSTGDDFIKRGVCTEAGLKRLIYSYLCKVIRKTRLFGNHYEWFVRKWLNMQPLKPIELAWRNLGTQGLKQKYRENLIAVLSQLPRLLDTLNGKVLITADHGELLGEKNMFSHPGKSQNPILTEIPCLTITAKSKMKFNETNSFNEQKEEGLVEDKLSQLGYM